MTNPYIKTEVEKILKAQEGSLSHALASSWVIAHFKGINIKVYNTEETSSLCDYNIVASAENTTQAKAMVAAITSCLREAGLEILSLEGLSDGKWILLDIGDIIVHIFQETSRDVFNLDELWLKSPQVEIPQEYYFGKREETATQQDTTENYF